MNAVASLPEQVGCIVVGGRALGHAKDEVPA